MRGSDRLGTDSGAGAHVSVLRAPRRSPILGKRRSNNRMQATQGGPCFDAGAEPRLAAEFLTDPRHHIVVAIEGDHIIQRGVRDWLFSSVGLDRSFECGGNAPLPRAGWRCGSRRGSDVRISFRSAAVGG